MIYVNDNFGRWQSNFQSQLEHCLAERIQRAAALGEIERQAALSALAALPVLNVAATRFTRKMFPAGMRLQEELGELSGVVEESVTGVRVVKGFGAERRQVARVQRRRARVGRVVVDHDGLCRRGSDRAQVLDGLAAVGHVLHRRQHHEAVGPGDEDPHRRPIR